MITASQGLGTQRPATPLLDRAIALVTDRMPAAAEDIEAELRSQRLTSGLFRLEGVIHAAELFGRRLPFTITELERGRLVHARDVPLVKTIVHTARRLISHWGMTTLSNVVTQAREFESVVCDKKFVVSALTCLEDFHWLDQSAEWFWLSNSYNRVLNRVRKILSVANPINVLPLQAGIGRGFVMGSLPPKRIILEFCRQVQGLQVNDETVRAEPPIGPNVLTKTERDIVRLLSKHGGTVTRSELESACLGKGGKRRTFNSNLAFSPIVSRCGIDQYRLVGSGERSGRRSNEVKQNMAGSSDARLNESELGHGVKDIYAIDLF